MRARSSWVFDHLSLPDGVDADLVQSSAGVSWVVRVFEQTPNPGFWILAEAEETLAVRSWPKTARADGPKPRGATVLVTLWQNKVRDSTTFDWDHLHRLWPRMAAHRQDWAPEAARPKSTHDKEAVARLRASGAPPISSARRRPAERGGVGARTDRRPCARTGPGAAAVSGMTDTDDMWRASTGDSEPWATHIPLLWRLLADPDGPYDVPPAPPPGAEPGVATIAAWRTPAPTTTSTTRAVSRAEAIRLARRIRALDSDLAANRTALTAAVTAQAPELLKVRGVGPVVAATVLHAWSHPGRIHSEAAFAALAGVSPLPASSGHTRRHRLNRGGDRRRNRALYTVALTRLGHHPRTRDYLARRTPKAPPAARSSASSSATSAANSSGSSPPPSHARSPLDTHRSISVWRRRSAGRRCRSYAAGMLVPTGTAARGIAARP
jgi:hypothetical protein